MKKIALILFVFISSCGNKNFTSADLKNNPEMMPFVLPNTNFISEHDLDLGKLEFSYSPKSNTDSVLAVIKNNALKNHWSLINSDFEFLKFTKNVQSFLADNQKDTVEVYYSSKQKIVSVKWN
jgi:hypothetical protein